MKNTDTTTDQQKDFEFKVCNIFNFNNQNSMILQRGCSEQMIIDDFNGDENVLSGTLAYKRNSKDFLCVVTYDSEVNHVEIITFKMLKIIIKEYCTKEHNKVILATNIPIEIHSSNLKELKKDFNFHIERIGFSFCQKHNLEFTEIY
jgi:hypothetical protein